MLDSKLIRTNPELIKTELAKKKFSFNVEEYLSIEESRKTYQVKIEELQNQRNTLSQEIGKLKSQNKNADDLIKQVNDIKIKLEEQQQKFKTTETALDDIYHSLPNLLHSSVPEGKDENDNQVINLWGDEHKLVADFAIKDHINLAEYNGWLDLKQASTISSSRFSLFQGDLAWLHRALSQFMLDSNISQGYQETYTPYIVNAKSLFGTGQLPKFSADLFKLDTKDLADDLKDSLEAKDLFLIPTAEVPLTNIAQNKILAKEDLPIKLVAHTPCFRSEAGSYGKDTRGLIRQHQFDKVELVHLVNPKNSDAALEELTSNACAILEALELPYRKIVLCSGDTGFGSSKTYDLEVWLPSAQTYREISSCSNMTDFQARRMKARFKDGNNNLFIHTLNGSALAVGRTLLAVLENYQTSAGKIRIPRVLEPYLVRSYPNRQKIGNSYYLEPRSKKI